MPNTVEIHIKRREKMGAPQRWEIFEIPYRPNLNVISCLMEIRKNPVTKSGQKTTPPSWDMNCLEQVCGICTMVINGRVRQSCSALVDNLGFDGGPLDQRLSYLYTLVAVDQPNLAEFDRPPHFAGKGLHLDQ